MERLLNDSCSYFFGYSFYRLKRAKLNTSGVILNKNLKKCEFKQIFTDVNKT